MVKNSLESAGPVAEQSGTGSAQPALSSGRVAEARAPRDFPGGGGHPPSGCQEGRRELTEATRSPTVAEGIPEGRTVRRRRRGAPIAFLEQWVPVRAAESVRRQEFHLATAGRVTPRGAEPGALASAMTTLLVALFLLGTACTEGVKLVQETDSGGVVTYPFKGDNGYLFSPLRAEALQLIEKRCAGPYRIVKEGEAKGRSRIIENAGGPEVITERRWGIKFQCKGRDE